MTCQYDLFVRPKNTILTFEFGNLLCHLLPWSPRLHLPLRRHQRTAMIWRLLCLLSVLMILSSLAIFLAAMFDGKLILSFSVIDMCILNRLVSLAFCVFRLFHWPNPGCKVQRNMEMTLWPATPRSQFRNNVILIMMTLHWAIWKRLWGCMMWKKLILRKWCQWRWQVAMDLLDYLHKSPGHQVLSQVAMLVHLPEKLDHQVSQVAMHLQESLDHQVASRVAMHFQESLDQVASQVQENRDHPVAFLLHLMNFLLHRLQEIPDHPVVVGFLVLILCCQMDLDLAWTERPHQVGHAQNEHGSGQCSRSTASGGRKEIREKVLFWSCSCTLLLNGGFHRFIVIFFCKSLHAMLPCRRRQMHKK